MRAMEIDVSLETLAARAAAGDRAAFGALYTHYHDALYGFALRRLGRPEDAEDLVEQAFYKALRAIDDRDPNRPFNVWLFHLTRNLITDYYRTHKEWRAVEPEDRVEDSTEEQVLKSYLDARLETALENLTARQRWVIQMRFFEGMEYGEIATRMGCQDGAIRATQMRALRALRKALTAQGIDQAASA